MSGSQDHPTLLLVDDTAENLMILRFMLEPRGYRILTAKSGPSALEVIESDPPDLIILDVMMPGMDGFEVCRRLKANARTAAIPVIFLSALHSNEWKIQGLEVGSVDCISKPFSKNEVLARVDTHVRLRAAQKELETINARLRDEIAQRQAAEAALAQANRRLQDLADEDGLTKIANRRRLDQHLDMLWRHLAREQQPLAVIMVDIDHFKLFNDEYGHQRGDGCLQAVAKAIKSSVRRPADLAGRYGGEEFMVLLANTDLAGGVAVAESIRTAVAALAIPHQHSQADSRVGVSLGVSSAVPQLCDKAEDLVACADEALYQAKRAGRGRVQAHHSSSSTTR
jgi:diguanylate cyclase (GGDEF)-like protein